MAATIESFDQAGFANGLAALVGVAREDITLQVTAASINVIANIALSSAGDGGSSTDVLASVTALASDPAALKRRFRRLARCFNGGVAVPGMKNWQTG